jgi:hypothetical protein
MRHPGKGNAWTSGHIASLMIAERNGDTVFGVPLRQIEHLLGSGPVKLLVWVMIG